MVTNRFHALQTKLTLLNINRFFTLSGLTRVPNAADAKSNWSQPWSYSNTAGDNSAGYLTLGEPRTLKLSATFDF
jgi:iron complex outermembrane recepter protein